MNNSIRFFAIIVVGVINCAQYVQAHEQAGALGRKNSKVGGTDMYSVSCNDDGNGAPEHLYVDVLDTARPRNPALISISALSPADPATFAGVNQAANDAGIPSSGMKVFAGVGPYTVSISKSRSRKKGVEIYLLNFHCETATGVHTGTSETELLQNQ